MSLRTGVPNRYFVLALLSRSRVVGPGEARLKMFFLCIDLQCIAKRLFLLCLGCLFRTQIRARHPHPQRGFAAGGVALTVNFVHFVLTRRSRCFCCCAGHDVKARMISVFQKQVHHGKVTGRHGPCFDPTKICYHFPSSEQVSCVPRDGGPPRASHSRGAFLPSETGCIKDPGCSRRPGSYLR